MKALGEMLQEAHIAESQFDLVFKILDDLEGVDARGIEQLFYFKMNGQHEFEEEAKKVTYDLKMKELEHNGNTVRLQMRKDVRFKKLLLKKLVQQNIASN